MHYGLPREVAVGDVERVEAVSVKRDGKHWQWLAVGCGGGHRDAAHGADVAVLALGYADLHLVAAIYAQSIVGNATAIGCYHIGF